MMRCKIAREELSAYIDGFLDDNELQLLETHLESCADCRQELQDLKATVERIASLPQYSVPGSFRAELRSRLEADSLPANADDKAGGGVVVWLRQQWKKAPYRGAAAACLALFVLLGSYAVYSNLQAPDMLAYQDTGPSLTGESVAGEPDDTAGEDMIASTEDAAVGATDGESRSGKSGGSEPGMGIMGGAPGIAPAPDEPTFIIAYGSSVGIEDLMGLSYDYGWKVAAELRVNLVVDDPLQATGQIEDTVREFEETGVLARFVKDDGDSQRIMLALDPGLRDEFVAKLQNLGMMSENGFILHDSDEDYDRLSARLETLKEEAVRLSIHLEKAEKADEVVTLEDALSRVETEISVLTGHLEDWSSLEEADLYVIRVVKQP